MIVLLFGFFGMIACVILIGIVSENAETEIHLRWRIFSIVSVFLFLHFLQSSIGPIEIPVKVYQKMPRSPNDVKQ